MDNLGFRPKIARAMVQKIHTLPTDGTIDPRWHHGDNEAVHDDANIICPRDLKYGKTSDSCGGAPPLLETVALPYYGFVVVKKIKVAKIRLWPKVPLIFTCSAC